MARSVTARGGRRYRYALAGWILLAGMASAQNLRYDNHREVEIPDYATIRVGPFYSSISFIQGVYYRYSKGDGEGTDYIFENERGRIQEDGSDFPMISTLGFRNYVPITRHMDLDASFSVSYYYFPLGTEENEWEISPIGDDLTADISTEYRVTDYVRGTLYDRFGYLTDYVDSRGFEDDLGGQRNRHFENRFGTDLDWLVAKNKNVGLSLSRFDYIPYDEEFEDQERYEYEESLVYEQEILPGLVVGARARYTQRDYKVEERTDNTQTDYSVFMRGAAGSEGGLPLTEATSFFLSVGISAGASADNDMDSGEGYDESELSLGAGIQTQISEYTWHKITYSRGLRGGFDADLEQFDRWLYELHVDEKSGLGITFFTHYDSVQPVSEDESSYDDFEAGILLEYPLTDYVTLDGSYVFRKRMNYDPGEGEPIENQDDYYTRELRLGATVPIFASKRRYDSLQFRTYVEREERLSDLDELEYTRDTFVAGVEYRRDF